MTRHIFVNCTAEERALVDSLTARDGISIRELVMRSVRQYAGLPATDAEQRLSLLEQRVSFLETNR